MEVIPNYINALEDVQKQSKRPGNPIMADNLLLIANNAILLTECPPLAKETWEDLSKDKKDWYACKKMHKKSVQKAKLKKQAVGGQGQFGAAYGTVRQAPQVQQANGPTRSEADLDKYFDSLAAAVTTKKEVLE